MQCHIIKYLLHRYGGEEIKAAAEFVEQTAAGKLPGRSSPAPLEVRPSGSFAASVAVGKAPRVSGEIRPILQKIVENNQERHELIKRLREEMAEANRQEGQRVGAALQEFREARDLLSKIDTAGTVPELLSDEEILELLNSTVVLDYPSAEEIEGGDEKGGDKARI